MVITRRASRKFILIGLLVVVVLVGQWVVVVALRPVAYTDVS